MRSLLPMLLLPIVLLVLACGETPAPAPPKKAPPPLPPPIGIDLGRPELAAAARNVRKSCMLSELGDVSNCVGDVVGELARVEKQVGIVDSLWSYCHAIDDKDPGIQVMAANRTGQLAAHTVHLARPDAKLLACYLEKYSKVRNVFLAQQYIRSAAFLATALKQEEKLFEALDKLPAPPDLQRTAHEGLWPNGRMRVLPRLKKALESKDVEMRKAVVLGFGYVKSLEGEETAVCGLLGPLLDEENAGLATMVAQRLAALCPEQHRDVLAAIQKAIAKKAIGLGLVEALQTIAASGGKEKKASVAMLAAVAGQKPLPQITRRAAQRALEAFDPRLAGKLGKQLDAEPQPREPKALPPPKGTKKGTNLTILPTPPAKKP